MRYCRRFLAGIPHCGAGTHVLLTRAPLPPSLAKGRTYDLHVLGTPPAFILSQDQTRHPIVYAAPPHGGECSMIGSTSGSLTLASKETSRSELRSRPSCLLLV